MEMTLAEYIYSQWIRSIKHARELLINAHPLKLCRFHGAVLHPGQDICIHNHLPVNQRIARPLKSNLAHYGIAGFIIRQAESRHLFEPKF